jgi:uncharacterized protein
MSESKGQHEPSMEEILASIRRIIAEDGDQPAAGPTAAPAPAAPPPEPAAPAAAKGDEILELTEVVEDHPPEPDPAPEPPKADPPPALAAAESGDRLVSDAAAAASIAALSQLHQLGPKDEKRMSDIPLGEGQRTIEDMVRDMLRPLLKEWLDSNLPHLVERVVQDEVARLVRDAQKR